MTIRSIIFDLDGTLINSAPDVRLAINHVLKIEGLSAIDREEVFTLIGHGALSTVQNAFKKKNKPLSEEDAQVMLANYLAYYKNHPVVDSEIYPDVVEVLQQLKMEGFRLGICTNKPSLMTHIVLEKLDLKNYFEAIISADEVSHPKPHHSHLHAVLQQMGTNDHPAVMIGDSRIDQLCAKNAGIPFIGVRYGYETGLKAEKMINHFHELPDTLRLIEGFN